MVPVTVPSALVFLAVGVVFWQESRRQETLADGLLAISFVVWTIVRVGLFAFRDLPQVQGPGLQAIAAVPAAIVAMLRWMAFYE